MPTLKAKYSDHGEIPEKYRELYVERDAEWFLDADGVEDVTGMKTAMGQYRREKEEALKRLKQVQQQFGDLDPEKARDAVTRLQELEEKKLLDAGKVEEMFKQRTERLERDYRNQLAAAQKDAAEKDSAVQELRKRLHSTVIDVALRDAAAKAGVRAEAMDLVLKASRDVWHLPDGSDRPVLMDGDQPVSGPGGKPMTPEAYFAQYAKDKPFLFQPSQGGGAVQSGGRVQGGEMIITMAEARDRTTYLDLKTQADKAGAKLRVRD